MSDDATPAVRRVKVGTGPETIRTLKRELTEGLLPDTYVSDGALVHMETVSGGLAGAADEDSPLPVTASMVNPAGLAGLLAEHAHVYRTRVRKDSNGDPEKYDEECTPPREVLSAVLAGKTWPGVPALRGIIGAPVLRRDGTLLQEPGYDPATGLYLASKVDLPRVPEQPSPEQVAEACGFLLGRFLRDFPWSSSADRANYVALLATPILRHFTRSLTPFGLIDATMPASGKSILTGGPGMLYGQKILTWPEEDGELRKSITAVFTEQVGAVIWDNLTEGTVIDSAVLAQLITQREWSDRQLGASRNIASVNDRLWMATGNNLQVGGDMASRTVRVHLDPNMPHPESRDQSGFGIPHLDQWITSPAHQMTVLWHLLIMVLDWTRNGAPRDAGLSMRQFTPWAQALGGFLAHHGIDGFLTNITDVRAVDEEATRWRGFLSAWHERHGSTPVTAAKLRASADPVQLGGELHDPWDGLFITTKNGRLPNAIVLGRILNGQNGRWRGEYVLRAEPSERGDRSVFHVEHHGD
ncbi:hypothetical protein [Paractinoplanes brasiliensis]|uniref:Uncharacterized protein n=1 Tax=Paractinoplanes brasiliensis TaxID=52695 RepID=A0A4R6JQX6_9ACTN|nr:hypothetical protein [Actinoplanes brasiliensis]TDO38407.1 hypothetical protein C8E87_2060 [Actinoplanes brasiliensis]GID26817.1 hypothetical protein Abr02nite_18000 [Actinoplanes brasiliensis]